MRGTADMRRTLRKRRFGMLFSIVTGLMVSLTVAPARAADLDLPTDAKILEALKAKRLTRCPQAGTRPRCGGARLWNPPLKGRLAMSKSLSMTAPPLFRARALSFCSALRQSGVALGGRFGDGTRLTTSTIPMSRNRSTTWRCSTPIKVATPTPNRSKSERWRSARKRAVPTILMSRHRSTTWQSSTASKAATPMPSRSTSGWRSWGKRLTPIVQHAGACLDWKIAACSRKEIAGEGKGKWSVGSFS
jgi:hypothetical protein